MELDGKLNDSRRPQQLSEEFHDYMGGISAYYSF
jgi:hypothetical protein